MTATPPSRNLDWNTRESDGSESGLNISMKSRYAVRALTELARLERSQAGRLVRLSEVAERRGVVPFKRGDEGRAGPAEGQNRGRQGVKRKSEVAITMSAPPEPKKFRPYVPPDMAMSEFTIRAVVLGLVLTVVLGAANAYLGLRAGMTIAAPCEVQARFPMTMPKQW